MNRVVAGSLLLVLAYVPASEAQVIVNPNEIVGRVRFTNTDPDVLHILRGSDETPPGLDYGLGSLAAADTLSVADKWKVVIRDGPECGVHSVVWCDSYHNLQRSLDRRLLREFELRVVYQMNTADSSQLIDSPVAGHLGIHPALFYDDGHGSLEKFLPYRMPHSEWWQRLAASFRARDGIENETRCPL